MGNYLFGEPKTLAQIVDEQRKAIQKAERNAMRECQRAQIEEMRLQTELTRAARTGRTDMVSLHAQRIVETRRLQRALIQIARRMGQVKTTLVDVHSQVVVEQTMVRTTRLLHRFNQRLNAPALNRIMVDFSASTESMRMKQELIQDALDDRDETLDDDAAESNLLGNAEGRPLTAEEEARSIAEAAVAQAGLQQERRLLLDAPTVGRATAPRHAAAEGEAPGAADEPLVSDSDLYDRLKKL